MILKVAIRSLLARPVRSAVLAVGFGLGVGVMAALLGIGDVILDQARAPALAGGGDVVIGTASGQVPNAPFVLYALRAGGPFGAAGRRRWRRPERDTMFLRHDGRAVPVAVRGGIPSAERAFGDAEISGVRAWTDTAADRRLDHARCRRVCCARSIAFTRSRTVPARASSWAEWLYFNGRSRASGASI